MAEYRRVNIKGGTYFFTLVTYQRQRIFSIPQARHLLIEAIDHIYKFHPFQMHAYCILPDHVHFIWQLPENDADYSSRISLIKGRFSKHCVAQFGLPLPKDTSRTRRRELTIWQRRFWEHCIRDEKDLNQHIDYIHYNPVKHGIVRQVRDWSSSSFFDYVRSGHYEIDWGDSYQAVDSKLDFGE